MDNTFEIIKNANIDDLYLSSIGFNPRGKSGCCPIHSGDNKNAFSYRYNKGQRQYTCWTKGCIEGADIIEVCKVRENLKTRYEACIYLADMFNIPIPKKENTKEQKEEFKKLKELAKKKSTEAFKAKKAYEKALEHKDLDKALIYSNLEDKINSYDIQKEESEIINYSMYKADDKRSIDKYIGENEGLCMRAISKSLEGENVLMVAPTGSGKTYTVLRMLNQLKELGVKSLFISPNASNVQQITEEYKRYNVAGAYDDISPLDLMDSEIICMTWDKAIQLENEFLEDRIIVIDEIHQTFTDLYREKAINGLYRITNKCMGRLDITATPTKLDFKIYKSIYEYEQSIKTSYNFNMYSNVNKDIIIDICNKSKKVAMLYDNKSELQMIKDKLDKNIAIITADDKGKEPYQNIICNSNIGALDGIFNTSVIVAGVNIYDKDITDIIIIGIKDIGTIKQYVARFRDLMEVNIHLFNTYKEQCNIYSVDYLVEAIENEVNKDLDIFNQINQNGFIGLSLQGLLNDNIRAYKGIGFDMIYYDRNDIKYKTNKFAIIGKAYNHYYNSRTIESFKVLLEEYFGNINIITTTRSERTQDEKEFIKNRKEAKKEAMEYLETKKDILVGYSKVIRHKENASICRYYNVIRKDIDSIRELYSNELSDIVNDNGLKSTLDVYTDLVIDYGIGNNLAWKISELTEAKRKEFYAKVNNVIFFEFLEEKSDMVNNLFMENRIFKYLVDNISPGTSFIDEHFDQLAEDIRVDIGIKLTKKKIINLLNCTFNIDENRHKVNIVASKNYNFFKNNMNLVATNEDRKQIRIYTIKNNIDLESLINGLSIESEQEKKDLLNFINKRKAKSLISTM